MVGADGPVEVGTKIGVFSQPNTELFAGFLYGTGAGGGGGVICIMSEIGTESTFM